MPGPRNIKKKKQVQAKKTRRTETSGKAPELEASPAPQLDALPVPSQIDSSQPAAHPPVIPDRLYAHETHDRIYVHDPHDDSSSESDTCGTDDDREVIPLALLTEPFIHDPGSGPRVRDTRAFLASSFAAPASLDDPLCAEFAQDEMLEMLSTILPEETALILWYNRSRKTARVCPACQRLYRLGDVLPDHLDHEKENSEPRVDAQSSPYLLHEQELSGLCSPVCFIVASFNYPGAIRSTWGRGEEELDDETWDMLDGPGAGAAKNDMGLGLLLKMTRCSDLGLGELFFPDEDMDGEPDEGAVCEDDEATEMTPKAVRTTGIREQEGSQSVSSELEGLQLRMEDLVVCR
ncbi:uncharacterized protein FIBRA_03026 [Fibroporia radiculosa]|uniref:Uncharacterized protein n=1 Tax=Fibroporia radiculosa TaxID=599839 RepID=J4G3U9_9APHY|nr:uncharacterized protein FIBRA_03026 [Fibroporia radiculosa]CCM00978.1 predicted protein [Fibroporia radiculosa]